MTTPRVDRSLPADGPVPPPEYALQQQAVFARLELAALAIKIVDGPSIGLPPTVRQMLLDQIRTAYPDAGEDPAAHEFFQWDLAEFRRWYWMNVGALLDKQADVLQNEHDALLGRYQNDADALDLARHLAWWHQAHRGMSTPGISSAGPAAGEQVQGGAPTPADVYAAEVVRPILEEAGVASIEDLRELTRSRHPVFAFIDGRASWDGIEQAMGTASGVRDLVRPSVQFIRTMAADLRDRAEDARWADKDGYNWRYWEPVLQLTALQLFPQRRQLAELGVRLGMERVSATPADVAEVAGNALAYLALMLETIASAGTTAPATLALLGAWADRGAVALSIAGPVTRMFETRDLEDLRVAEQLGVVAPLVAVGASPETDLVVAVATALAGAAIARVAAGKSSPGTPPSPVEPWVPDAPPPRPPGSPPPEGQTPRMEARAAWEPDVAEDLGLVRGESRPTTPAVTGKANEARIRRLLDRSQLNISEEQVVWFEGKALETAIGPKGSSIPEWEAITDGQKFYIELKSYARLLDANAAKRNAGIADLVSTTAKQLERRRANLPPDAPQYVLIDLSGRGYGPDVAEQVRSEIRDRLVDKAGGIIKKENIAFFD